MLIHSILPASRANGPGLRAVVWTQGCTLACSGCHNPLTHDANPKRCNRCHRRMNGSTAYDGACSCGGLIEAAAREISPEDLAAEIIRTAPPEVEGITWSGGEPLQQAYHLLETCVHIRSRQPRWSIGLFSGYYVSELEDGQYAHGQPPVLQHTRRALWYRIRRYLDFAVMGRYDATAWSDPAPPPLRRRVADPLCSTPNQRLWLWSHRYTRRDFSTVYEATIAPGGLTQITGFPTSQVLHKPATEGRTT